MALFWYPEIVNKHDFKKHDKAMLLNSYIRYYLSRLQSMFIYEGLPDSIPQKWLENYLFTYGYCVFIKAGINEDGTDKIIVTNAGMGAKPNEYYIPTQVIVTNPYIPNEYNGTYTIDKDCILIRNDTYIQGLLPLLNRYCSALIENSITMNIADVLTRATITMSAVDDNTKASAELWLQRLYDGNLGIIGEAPFLAGNQDKSLNINQLVNVASTLTDLIEYNQYLKASLYNELGLQSNYNMKRESINSNESQLNEDMLHPFIDNMLAERKEALEKVNEMFGLNISVRFNSAWEMNEREEQAAIAEIEAAAEGAELANEEPGFIEDKELPSSVSEEEFEEEKIDEDTAKAADEAIEASEELPEVEVTLTDNAIEEIAEAVADKLKEGENEDAEEDK